MLFFAVRRSNEESVANIRLLFVCCPGRVKSTLAHKFYQDMGKGDIWLESVELHAIPCPLESLLHISLRKIIMQKVVGTLMKL